MQEMSTEIVFFDLETNVPKKPDEKFWVLEFGAMVVCPRKLIELESYDTLIRPGDLSVVGVSPARCHGISRATVSEAPSFAEVADKVFKILNGRIWAGHNIRRFDCVRIREAFKEIGRAAPEPAALIDSLPVLSEKFGRRAGDMKMASLASYFGLGEQKHRSLDDVRMNLEVVKRCATVLFLESALPGILEDQLHHNISPTITTRSRSNVMFKLPSISNTKRWYKEAAPVPVPVPVTITTRSRKSPSVLNRHRVMPYPVGSFSQVTETAKKNVMRDARNTPLNDLLKHSCLLLR